MLPEHLIYPISLSERNISKELEQLYESTTADKPVALAQSQGATPRGEIAAIDLRITMKLV